jgi:hypothetical protein
MTYMRIWKKSSTYSHTWLGLNPQIGRPLSRIVVPLVYFLFFKVHTKPYMSAPSIIAKFIFVIKNNQTQSEDRNKRSLIQRFRNLSRVRNI